MSAARIAPPRLGGKKVGTLTTRSPHRPNNIGLSVCQVLGVHAHCIEIGALDFVNGTPVLDIKPYIPYDVVPSSYKLPMATDSYGHPLHPVPLTVPAWVVDPDIPLKPVHLSVDARTSLGEYVYTCTQCTRTTPYLTTALNWHVHVH